MAGVAAGVWTRNSQEGTEGFNPNRDNWGLEDVTAPSQQENTCSGLVQLLYWLKYTDKNGSGLISEELLRALQLIPCSTWL